MTLNRLINELMKVYIEHGDLPVRMVQETQIPAHSPTLGRKRVASEPVLVKEDEGVAFIEGAE